jgi:N-acetylglucosamine malate deacetylase 1
VKILVVAPHPDDEILGCGGTMLRRKSEGANLGWLIVTEISVETGWSLEQVQQREEEIAKVASGLGVDRLYNLQLPTTRLDTIPMSEMIDQFSGVFKDFEPEEVLIPHRGDVHTDHRVVFDAVSACCKWFRYPSVCRVMAYETRSETEFGLDPNTRFSPNVFVNISNFLERKLELMQIYQSEVKKFPFPRSIIALKALAQNQGASSGFEAAEAFQLLNERLT